MSLVNTLMQSLRSAYPANYDKNEVRESRYGAWDFFKQDTDVVGSIFSQDTKANIKKSFGNSVVIPVLDAETVTIGNVRSCTIADDENTSNLVTLTFATYAFGFTMTPAQHYNNNVNYQADFDRKLKKYLVQFASTLDTAAIAQLETNKNQLNTGLTDFYPFSGGLQVTQAQRNDFYNNLQAIMRVMDFYDKIHIVSSTSGLPMVNRLQAQGAGNATNEQFQFGYNQYQWWDSNRIANAGGIQSTLYAVQEGSVAVENRNDPDAIMKSNIGDFKEWDEVQVPIVGLNMGSFYSKDCADRSALNTSTSGLTRTLLEGFEWSTDLCFATAYNSAIGSRYNPILKAQISAT